MSISVWPSMLRFRQVKLPAAADSASLLRSEELSTGQAIISKALKGRNCVFIAQLTVEVGQSISTREEGKHDFNANGSCIWPALKLHTGVVSEDPVETLTAAIKRNNARSYFALGSVISRAQIAVGRIYIPARKFPVISHASGVRNQ